MNKYYITFGYNHKHIVKSEYFDHDTVGVIFASTYQEAREIAFKNFGEVWAFLYDNLEKVGLENYSKGLKKVNIDPKIKKCFDDVEASSKKIRDYLDLNKSERLKKKFEEIKKERANKSFESWCERNGINKYGDPL